MENDILGGIMYKPEIRQQIEGTLANFAKQEVGNRITQNNWSFLELLLKATWDNKQFQVEPEKKKGKEDG